MNAELFWVEEIKLVSEDAMREIWKASIREQDMFTGWSKLDKLNGYIERNQELPKRTRKSQAKGAYNTQTIRKSRNENRSHST